jgi:queuine/archaeosine tRNA-ribosyltransferase
MDLIYVPVLYDVSKGARWEWYTGASGLKHPFILISAGDGTYGMFCRNKFEKPPGVKLFADSGGFQLQVEGRYVSPETVASWQEKIDADVRFILDHPPLLRINTVAGQQPLHGADFRKKLDETISDTKRMLATYKNPNKETYGVLQGETIEEIIQWRDEINTLHPFAGWGLGSTFGDVAQFRLKIKLLGEIGVKKIHLFGVTDPAMLIVVSRAMRKYNVEYCTFDSTSYIGTKFSSVWYPIVNNQVGWFSRTENRPTLRLVCDCPVCRVLKPNDSLDLRDIQSREDNLRKHNEVEFGYKVGVHNIFWINQMARSIQELSKYEDLLAELENEYSGRVKDSKIDQKKKATDYE